MSSKECELQLNQLIIDWDEDRATRLNATDIEAIKHLLLENQVQQDRITELRIQVSSREEVANKYKEVIEEVRECINQVASCPADYFEIEVDKTFKQVYISEWLDKLLQILDKAKEEK